VGREDLGETIRAKSRWRAGLGCSAHLEPADSR
jgi:hypothetical protein